MAVPAARARGHLSFNAAAAAKRDNPRAQGFRVTIPRHSIEKAREAAAQQGWATSISRVRSSEPDAPDVLQLVIPGGALRGA